MNYSESLVVLRTKRSCTLFLIDFDDKQNTSKSEMPIVCQHSHKHHGHRTRVLEYKFHHVVNDLTTVIRNSAVCETEPRQRNSISINQINCSQIHHIFCTS